MKFLSPFILQSFEMRDRRGAGAGNLFQTLGPATANDLSHGRGDNGMTHKYVR